MINKSNSKTLHVAYWKISSIISSILVELINSNMPLSLLMINNFLNIMYKYQKFNDMYYLLKFYLKCQQFHIDTYTMCQIMNLLHIIPARQGQVDYQHIITLFDTLLGLSDQAQGLSGIRFQRIIRHQKGFQRTRQNPNNKAF